MITGAILRDSILSGANNLANQRARVDELNVFPVPDGDTGTNMSMTIGSARTELEALADDCTVETASQVVAGAMLRGARGNSGVISSLLFRGFSKALKGKKAADAADLVAALQKGVEGAYKAVMKPTEGTMLTVARVAGEEAAKADASSMDPAQMWELICNAAQAALDNTPNQLPVLKKAGVVDAGGQGLMCIFLGMLSVLRDGKIIEASEAPAKKSKLSTDGADKGVYTDDLMTVEDIVNGYCTQFLVNKNENASSDKLRAFLESNGDSVVVIEDDEVINCHVHTQDPGKIISHALQYGYLTSFKIENMHEQFLARQKQGAGLRKQAAAEASTPANEFSYAAVDQSRDFGFVAVAAGDGLKTIFADLGVDAVVSGGQTMNPATEDIVAAVQSVPAKTVFVLPNNKNIIMAAEQAQKIADRTIVVLPTRTIPQGITAMLNFDPSLSADENNVNMMQAADHVATGLVTFAARDSDFDGKKIKKGEILALENGKLVATGTDITKTTYRLARSMCKKDTSFVTVISGCDVSEEDAERTAQMVQAKCPSGVEVTHLVGGQPVYYYIISVE
ncbi:DAK2 domain-containing protein [uncultured Ruthenibacterium sp.]|uniref:DAK2 domain-containing protein n=1 Tax=uncultured Ruthenibacterium sp. TaxID=1905347 RepID=UPI00349E64D0